MLRTDGGKFGQHGITYRMAEIVVDCFEVIEIDQRQTEILFFLSRNAQLLLCKRENTAPIRQTRQFVAHRKIGEATVLLTLSEQIPAQAAENEQ